MKKRDFIKTGLLLTVGSITTISKAGIVKTPVKKVFDFSNHLPEYSTEQIAKLFSKSSFLEHLRTYSNNADKLLSDINSLVFQPENVKSIITHSDNYNTSLVNKAIDHFNHKIFFKQFGNPNPSKNTSILSAIKNKYGSISKFKTALLEANNELTNEGWIWLIYKNNDLQIITLNDNKNPFLSSLNSNQKGFPVIAVDMHEHCYAPDYKNNRETYINNLVDSLNWDFIEKRYQKATTNRLT